MKRKIFKYPLQITDSQKLEIPKHSTPLSLQVQDGKPTLWVMVDEEKPKTPVTIICVGTGNPVPDELDILGYLGTSQVNGFVWHFFFLFSTTAFQYGIDN